MTKRGMAIFFCAALALFAVLGCVQPGGQEGESRVVISLQGSPSPRAPGFTSISGNTIIPVFSKGYVRLYPQDSTPPVSVTATLTDGEFGQKVSFVTSLKGSFDVEFIGYVDWDKTAAKFGTPPPAGGFPTHVRAYGGRSTFPLTLPPPPPPAGSPSHSPYVYIRLQVMDSALVVPDGKSGMAMMDKTGALTGPARGYEFTAKSRILSDRYGRILLSNVAKTGTPSKLSHLITDVDKDGTVKEPHAQDSLMRGLAFDYANDRLYCFSNNNKIAVATLAEYEQGNSPELSFSVPSPYSYTTTDHKYIGAVDDEGHLYIIGNDTNTPPVPHLLKLEYTEGPHPSLSVKGSKELKDLTLLNFTPDPKVPTITADYTITDMFCHGGKLYVLCYAVVPQGRNEYYAGRIVRIDTNKMAYDNCYGPAETYKGANFDANDTYWNGKFYGMTHILGFEYAEGSGSQGSNAPLRLILADEAKFVETTTTTTTYKDRYLRFDLSSFKIVTEAGLGPKELASYSLFDYEP